MFRRLVLARVIEPTSKLDGLRVLAETGISGPSYRKRFEVVPGCWQDGGPIALATDSHNPKDRR